VRYTVPLALIALLAFAAVPQFINAGPVLPDYTTSLDLPQLLSDDDDVAREESAPLQFSFKLGDVDGDLLIAGSWKLKLGFGTGFTLYPELTLLNTISDMNQGVVFEQKRAFALDWATGSGINLHLFFNDIVDQTEVSFTYEVGKIFKELYITNAFNDYTVNPWRSLSGGGVQDVNFGFSWGHSFYQGRFDLQFDSVKQASDTFRGTSRQVDGRLLSSEYVRGVYYYLPDSDIKGSLVVYASDPAGDFFYDLTGDLSDDRRYLRLEEETDYRVNPLTGHIIFKNSVYGKTVLAWYQADSGSNRYDVGDPAIGRGGLKGSSDFDRLLYPEYFTWHENRWYLVLARSGEFSFFEEKNSYQVTAPGGIIEQFNAEVRDESGLSRLEYSVLYDSYTGCLKVFKSSSKGVQDYVYPFRDSVDFSTFYGSYFSPEVTDSRHTIDFSGSLTGESLILSSMAVPASVRVFLNGTELEDGLFGYDQVTNTVSLEIEISDVDLVEVKYVTVDREDIFLTATLANDFRINRFLRVGDSFWYRMPVNLWEDSYWFKRHALEFIYNVQLVGDFSSVLRDPEKGQLEFGLNAAVSVYHPEIRGITLIDDFEYEESGLKLDLDYRYWYPVSIPELVYPSLAGSSTGRLFYRNLHRFGNPQDIFISLYDGSAPDRDEMVNGAQIGPYSSSDGYSGEKNSLSLVTEFELDAGEAVSCVFPAGALAEDVDFTRFDALTAAIKAIELSGSVRLYIDGGRVSERFDQSTDLVVQREDNDDGISYSMTDSGAYTLYKGRLDGVETSNDLDGDGLLLYDVTADISTFTSSDTSDDHLLITPGYQDVPLFAIDNPDKLRVMRGLRLTVVADGGPASGRLLFNQLRFTRSGWNVNGPAVISEIFPAEDSYLSRHIFSREQAEFDQRLHFQRFRERSLKISLDGDIANPVQVTKRFITPVNVSQFKIFGFFLLQEQLTGRELTITMRDASGNSMNSVIDLSSYTAGRWTNIRLDFDTFNGYTHVDELVTEIAFEFEAAADEVDIFLDELYLDTPVTSVGFGTSNSFLFSDPGLSVMRKGLELFASPQVSITTAFETGGFTREELDTLGDHALTNKFQASFSTLKTSFSIKTFHEVTFSPSGAKLPGEQVRIKISRSGNKTNPLHLSFLYDYKNSAVPDISGALSSSADRLERLMVIESGTTISSLGRWKAGIDLVTKQSGEINRSAKVYGGIQLGSDKSNWKLDYAVITRSSPGTVRGTFSLDNFGYQLVDDITAFGLPSTGREQDLTMTTSLPALPWLNLKHSLLINHRADDTELNSLFSFAVLYTNSLDIQVSITSGKRSERFFTGSVKRRAETVHDRAYTLLDWSSYLSEFAVSVSATTPVLFYPPFSSLFVQAGTDYMFDDLGFSTLEDSFSLVFDWGMFVPPVVPAPVLFTASVKENITNTIDYKPNWTLDFSLAGEGAWKGGRVKEVSVFYQVDQQVVLKTGEETFTTGTSCDVTVQLLRGFIISTFLSYEISYLDSSLRRELSHEVVVQSSVARNFYRRNWITGDKYGVEMNIVAMVDSLVRQRFDAGQDRTDNPFGIRLKPKVGYRFNRNLSIYGIMNLGYDLDYTWKTGLFTHRFGMEIFIEGVLSF
jgi:hypothetical protein